MNREQIYLKAAELIASGDMEFSCQAIDKAVGCVGSDERWRYSDLLGPSESAWGGWGRKWSSNTRTRRDCRVLALCFMAAIVSRRSA